MTTTGALRRLGLAMMLMLTPSIAAAIELPSHLGVPPDAFVALEYKNVTNGYSGCHSSDTICDTPLRIMPDGSRESFSIPRDAVLIVTDIAWTASGSDEGDDAHVRVSDASYLAEARFDSRKRATYREHLTSGLVFSKVPVFIFAHHLDAKLSRLIIRGYLTPLYADKPIPFPGELKRK
jgi:hypothetical protein